MSGANGKHPLLLTFSACHPKPQFRNSPPATLEARSHREKREEAREEIRPWEGPDLFAHAFTWRKRSWVFPCSVMLLPSPTISGGTLRRFLPRKHLKVTPSPPSLRDSVVRSPSSSLHASQHDSLNKILLNKWVDADNGKNRHDDGCGFDRLACELNDGGVGDP